MKYYLLTLLTSIIAIKIHAQDTLYSYSFPKGIITTSLETNSSSYKLYPIENRGLEIIVSKKEVKQIKYASGGQFDNVKYSEGDNVVLPTEPATGKIFYSDVINFKGSKAKDLFLAIKKIPQTLVSYSLVSEDATDYTFLKYVGNFGVRYAGDPYTVYFNLLVRIKDEKIKYEYSDFVTTFVQAKSRQAFSLFTNGVNTTTDSKIKLVDQLYGRSSRNGDTEKFWKPIDANINESIKMLLKQGKEASGKNDW